MLGKVMHGAGSYLYAFRTESRIKSTRLSRCRSAKVDGRRVNGMGPLSLVLTSTLPSHTRIMIASTFKDANPPQKQVPSKNAALLISL